MLAQSAIEGNDSRAITIGVGEGHVDDGDLEPVGERLGAPVKPERWAPIDFAHDLELRPSDVLDITGSSERLVRRFFCCKTRCHVRRRSGPGFAVLSFGGSERSGQHAVVKPFEHLGDTFHFDEIYANPYGDHRSVIAAHSEANQSGASR